jgi:hypothetical protein
MTVVWPSGKSSRSIDCSVGVVYRADGVATTMQVDAGMSVEFDNNTKATPALLFGYVEPFPLKPVIPTLVHLGDAVSDLIGQFDAFIHTI